MNNSLPEECRVGPWILAGDGGWAFFVDGLWQAFSSCIEGVVEEAEDQGYKVDYESKDGMAKVIRQPYKE